MTGSHEGLAEAQQRHWEAAYESHPTMFGSQPSQPALFAAGRFSEAGATRVLELGAGYGRDSLYFAQERFDVTAMDFSSVALAHLTEQAERAGLQGSIHAVEHDVRQPIPLSDASVDAVYSHMLLCMALSTQELQSLVAEARRVLVPGGVMTYTVRNIEDPHYGIGIAHGDEIFETRGFAVHFFDRALVGLLADGWNLESVNSLEEGKLPRRLWQVTQGLTS